MARVDDFQQARDLSALALSQQKLNEIADRSGWPVDNNTHLKASFLGREYEISYPAFRFTDQRDPSAQVPLQEQVLLLHYLQGRRPIVSGRWIAYREIPGAGFYFGAFVKRAIDPLKKVFGNNVAALAQAAGRLGGTPIETSGVGFCFEPLPYVPIQLIVWEGDEEFSAEANILFDASAGDCLSPEDAAWLASLMVYRLMGLAK